MLVERRVATCTARLAVFAVSGQVVGLAGAGEAHVIGSWLAAEGQPDV